MESEGSPKSRLLSRLLDYGKFKTPVQVVCSRSPDAQAARLDKCMTATATRIAGMENHPICPLDDDGGTGLIRERIKAPIRKRGWGLRRKAETAPQAAIHETAEPQSPDAKPSGRGL